MQRTLLPKPWRNWAGNVRCQPSHCAYPATLEEVQSELMRCTEEAERLRVVGGGHAHTPLSFSDENHMSLAHFTGIESVDKPRRRAWVRAGTRLGRLGQSLAQRGLALDVHGDYTQQTLGGALAGGLINSANGLSSLASLVTGFRVVLPNGTAHTVTQDNGDNFDAGRLSLGVMGVITHIELQCRTPYRLVTRRENARFDSVIDRLERLRRGHRHLTLYWHPAAGDVLLLSRNLTRAPVTRFPGRRLAQDFIANNLVGPAWDRTTQRAPGLTPLAHRINRLVGRDRPWVTESHEAFGRIRWVRHVESEYAIPVNAAPEALRQIDHLIRVLDLPARLPITVRFASADTAWLSPAYQQEVALIGLRAPPDTQHADYFAALWEVLDRHGGRPHWAKLHDKSAHELRQLYPRFDDFVALRQKVDPCGVLLNRYLANLLGVGYE
ncbi:MAG: D-arabinono-1,4-lactone oxidase [Polycyclovorans sp.]|jgi:FAD/FMN-containing dehydrogenase|nr:FAD-binding protein [Gammaproteobacteria bacterium]MDP1543393.1 D-arabinono-1,4-lactone oxidase [Polycyclovorans sp.]MEC8849046.1 D-arabinono-1,4-lactone oxidase [Pseudomonadota bacterium]|tara:strand:- start:6666 stop:7982 length:1317 start_codon:yes stop_codon:yes gene_type:complete